MTRKCSHCCNNGHNSRTCPNRGGVKLFGVRLTDGPIRKSASMGNLMMMANPSSPSDPSEPASAAAAAAAAAADGYLSDGLVQASTSNSRERKKGGRSQLNSLQKVQENTGRSQLNSPQKVQENTESSGFDVCDHAWNQSL